MDMGTVVALIKGLAPKADPAVIEQAVQDWLDDHPEATTTVEDGSITEAKLAADVAGILDDLQDDVTAVKTDYKNGTITNKILLKSSDMRQGSYNDDDAENSSTDRIATIISYFLVTGTEINYELATGHRLGVKIFEKKPHTAGNHLIGGTTRWLTGTGTFTISVDGYTVITVQVASGTLTPSDYNETIWFDQVLIPTWIDDIESNLRIINTNLIPSRIINPSFSLVKLPDSSQWVSGFQNFFEIGNEIWFCTASTFGSDTTGHIYRISKTDYSYIGRIWHNLGHMAQVDYDKEADRMLMCNTESSTEPKLYIFHNVSEWPDVAEEHSGALDVTNLDYDTVDLSELRTEHMNLYYVIACWAERQIDGNRLIVGEGTHGAQWFKIMLGMGTNDLGEGTYSPAVNDRFNGSYKTLWYKDCAITSIQDRDTPQANQGLICYGGKFFEPVGHEPSYGGIFTPLTSAFMRRDIFDIRFYNDDGTTYDNGDCEGCNVIDGKLCIGISGGASNNYLIVLDI